MYSQQLKEKLIHNGQVVSRRHFNWTMLEYFYRRHEIFNIINIFSDILCNKYSQVVNQGELELVKELVVGPLVLFQFLPMESLEK